MGSLSRARLDALVEEATVDCYNEDEQLTGLFAMIEGNLEVPFATQVLGVEVTVRRVDLLRTEIVAVCQSRSCPAGDWNPGSPATGSTAGGRGMDRGVPPLGAVTVHDGGLDR